MESVSISAAAGPAMVAGCGGERISVLPAVAHRPPEGHRDAGPWGHQTHHRQCAP